MDKVSVKYNTYSYAFNHQLKLLVEMVLKHKVIAKLIPTTSNIIKLSTNATLSKCDIVVLAI